MRRVKQFNPLVPDKERVSTEGVQAGVQTCGIEEKKDNALQGTPGLLSLRRYLSEGWNVLIF